MASAWVTERETKSGDKRYRVLFRVGGRESTPRHGGTFKRKRDATTRAGWINGELAALRVPDLRLLDADPVRLPTLAQAGEAWRVSRVDVVAQTGNMHRSAIGRIGKVAPALLKRRLDEITFDDIAALVTGLAANPYKRETIRKTRTALAQILDYYEIDPERRPRRAGEAPEGLHVAQALVEIAVSVGEQPLDAVLQLALLVVEIEIHSLALPLPAIADLSTNTTGGERAGVRGGTRLRRCFWPPLTLTLSP